MVGGPEKSRAVSLKVGPASCRVLPGLGQSLGLWSTLRATPQQDKDLPHIGSCWLSGLSLSHFLWSAGGRALSWE